MMNIDLRLAGKVGYQQAEEAAKEAAMKAGGSLSLLAWYDRDRKMGAPSEACSLENWKCVRDYAEHRDAEFRVSVNGDRFEFFFTRTPEDAEELDKEEVQDVHMGIPRSEFDNVQGG